MKYEEFKTNLIEELKDFYGVDATVELTTATKNNGIHLDGIIIRIGETNVAPIIYLQQYYEEYMENENISIDEIVGRIVELRERHELQDADGVIGKITDWAYVREHIYPMIVSAEDNEEMLRALVSKPFLDLAVIMYIRLDDILQIGGDATVKVTKEILSSLKVSEAEAFDVAFSNMKKDDYAIQDIYMAISGMIDEENIMDEPTGKMFVLTNKRKSLGAVGILDRDLLHSIGKDLFILPSSIHETILVPVDENMDQKFLDSMVTEVNATQLGKEEVLSGHSYYYDLKTNKIRIRKIE